ncbi:hypothetical protein CEUSTIGMA_g12817.t1 [Chlamydomonas eustigma]|uniref:non-specific serine/threonine protein kinase n=1 Tax=Chlamydomonas eustigma TaxID=1157962 RepID=A0A250XQP6_9CHLO|nr:hypothetical protein CEUSTIGMA_g12817.t1 [Chlamydomonas eustigma]|eukprot:GAX85401.1 hypothetical protein CEUSTIGMA_g12817.t1 [Chlamydomonas eustigma]
MGNVLAGPPPTLNIAEIPNTVVKDALGGGRFLRTLLCVHDEAGPMVVKVYYKRTDSPSLEVYKQQLNQIRTHLDEFEQSHVHPFRMFLETTGAAYLMRQYMFSNLYDRLSTRPFLSNMEKRWITYQLLHGLCQCHERGICHGDIKAENVLLTSWTWVYLADFAPYKPTFLPADNPAEFSYFFDTGGRRRCYIAPERFYTDGSKAVGSLLPSMDVFSMGCVIAELFLDGKSFLDLGQLLSLKTNYAQQHQLGTYTAPTWPQLSGIDADIRLLIQHMVQIDPATRWTAEAYLKRWPETLFPSYFDSVLHPFFASLLPLDTDARVEAARRAYPVILSHMNMLTRSTRSERVTTLPSNHPITSNANVAQASRESESRVESEGRPLVASDVVAAANRMLPLDELGSLLEDAASFMTKMQQCTLDGDLGDLGCINDESPQHSQERNGIQAGIPWSTTQQSSTHSPIDEVVMEEFIENQRRDSPASAWLPCSTEGGKHGKTGLDSVSLPLAPGWTWSGEWFVDKGALQRPGAATMACDAEGWEYHNTGQRSAAHTTTSTTSTSYWTSDCSSGCLLKRRKWLRQRRRRLHQGTVGTPLVSSQSSFPADPLKRGKFPDAAIGVKNSLTASEGGAVSVSPPMSNPEGVVPLVVLLCTLLRGARLYESKRCAMSLLVKAALQCDDEVRLQCAVPYLLTMLGDPAAGVRAMALRCAVKVMCSVQSIPPSDAKVFQDYLIPSLSLLPNDSEESVRVEYALGIAKLAASAHQHLLRMQHEANNEALLPFTKSNTAQVNAVTAFQPSIPSKSLTPNSTVLYNAMITPSNAHVHIPDVRPVRCDTELTLVRTLVESVVKELVISARSSDAVKRALLKHGTELAVLFGRKDLNEKVLPLLITCLNATDWALRASFFQAVSRIGAFTGRESLDVFLMPCLEQALLDPSENAVIFEAICSIAAVASHLKKRSLLAAARRVSILLDSEEVAVRAAAIALLAATARCLSPADVYTQLSVLLEGRLVREPADYGEEFQLASCLRQTCRDVQPVAVAEEDTVGRVRRLIPWGSSTIGGWGHGHVELASNESKPQLSAASDPTPNCFSDPLLMRHNMSAHLKDLQAESVSGRVVHPVVPHVEGSLRGYVETSSECLLMLHPLAPVYQTELEAAALANAVLHAAAVKVPEGRHVISTPVTDRTPAPSGVSLHQAAIDSINPRTRSLESHASQLADGLSHDSADPTDRQQLEKIKGILSRLRHPSSSSDVRDTSSLYTFQLLQLATRSVPKNTLTASLPTEERGRLLPSSAESLYPAASTSSTSSQAVSDAMAAALSTSLPGTSQVHEINTLDSAFSPWRPRGVLLAHLAEHRQPIHRLAVAQGGHFFVSASSDATVKVWDLHRLERDVSFQSRLTYAAQQGQITAVAAVEDDTSVASASSAGSIHLWRVEYTAKASTSAGRAGGSGGSGRPDKYTGVVSKRQLHPGMGSILEVSQWGPSLLVYTSQRGGVHAWDLRMKSDAWALCSHPSMGLTEHMVLEPSLGSGHQHWLLTGSSRGYLTLWDVRFQMPVNTWQHPTRCAIDAMSVAAAPPARLGLPVPSSGATAAPLVYVAAGRNEVGLWDVTTGCCRQVIRCLDHQDVTALDHTTHVPRALQPPVAGSTSFLRGSAAMAAKVGPLSVTSNGEPSQTQDSDSLSSEGNVSNLLNFLGTEGLTTPQPRPAGVRCMLPMPSGHLLTGGTDRGIRLWDAVRPGHSYLVCGPLWGNDCLVDPAVGGVLHMSQYRYSYDCVEMEGVRVVEERCRLEGHTSPGDAGSEMRQRLRVHDQAHADAVLHMTAVVDGTSNDSSSNQGWGGRLLLTCSRDGVIKAWR